MAASFTPKCREVLASAAETFRLYPMVLAMALATAANAVMCIYKYRMPQEAGEGCLAGICGGAFRDFPQAGHPFYPNEFARFRSFCAGFSLFQCAVRIGEELISYLKSHNMLKNGKIDFSKKFPSEYQAFQL